MFKLLQRSLCSCAVLLFFKTPLNAQEVYLFAGDRSDAPTRDGSIHRYRLDGDILTPAPSAGQTGDYWDKSAGQPHKGRRLTNMVVAPNGDVYAICPDIGSVLSFDGESGTYKGAVAQGLEAPDALTVGPDGNLYISNNLSIVRCTLDGKALPGAEQTGNHFAEGGRLRSASGLTFGPDGNLYVASQITGQVLRYDGHSGEFLGVFCAGDITTPSQIKFGPDSNLYVASTGGPSFNVESGYIAKFDGSNGQYLGKFAGEAKGAVGLAFAPDGDLFVSDYWTGKIKRFDAKTGEARGIVAENPVGSMLYYLTAAQQDEKTGRLKPVTFAATSGKPKLTVITSGANTVKGWKSALKPKGIAGPELVLASKKRTDYVIVVAKQPTTMDDKAAAVLSWWLQEMTSARFVVKHEGEPIAEGSKIISVGRTDLLEKSALKAAKLDLDNEGYAIASKGDTLFLWGGRTRGAIYAAYSLLEEDLGCRWYTSESSARIPRLETLRFRPVLRHFVPTLMIRDPYYADAFGSDWSLKNKTNSSAMVTPAAYGGAVNYGHLFDHTYNILVPPSQYFAAHPEYFAEVKGKRQPSQLDLSNPDVLRIATENLLKALRADPTLNIVSVTPNDGRGYCECPICSTLDKSEATVEGSKSASLINFVNKVAAAIEPEFPHVKVSTLAYLDTFMPPKTIRPRKNVVIQLCTDSHAWKYQFCYITESHDFQTAAKAWNAIGANITVWDYTSSFVHFMVPMPNMPVVSDNMRFFIEQGARGIMLQGTVTSVGGDNAAMRSWVWAKQMWDPSLDTRALMKDFIYGYYGDAAEPIWQYNDMLWQMWEKAHKIAHTPGVTKIGTHPLIMEAPCSAPPTWALMTPEYLAKSTSLFERAEALAKDDETLRRVQIAKLPLLYVKLGQGIGYIEEFGSFTPGTWVKKRDPQQRVVLQKLYDEFFDICSEAGVTRISDQSTPARLANQWKAILNPSLKVLPTIGLNNTWKFKTDAKQAGFAEGWATSQTDDKDWADVLSSTGTGWESQGFANYRGYAWYRQKFAFPASFEKRKHLYLYFGAVDSESEIFINGVRVFEHTMAATALPLGSIWNAPFSFDAAPYLKADGENIIAVRVTSNGGVRGVWKPAYVVSSNEEMTGDNLAITVMSAS